MTNSDISTDIGTTESGPPDGLDASFIRMAIVLLLGMLLALLDETIVNVGIKTLTAEFASPLSTIQWVTAGYLLAVSVAIPLSGWAVDRFGGKRMWLVSVSLFVLGSALCGMAWSVESLIAFRVVQGLGGGMIVPVVQAVLARAAGPHRVAKAMGLISIPLTVGPVLGPLLGGLLVDQVSWRWMFLINLPIGVFALLFAIKAVPADTDGDSAGHKLDLLGLLLLSPGFAALVYALSTAAHEGGFGSAKVVVTLILGAVFLLAYLAHALRGRITPLIDVRLFARRGFTMAVAVMFPIGAVANILLFLTPLYYQQIRGFGAVHAGLLLIPLAFSALGTMIAVRLGATYTPRVTSPIAMLIAALGTLLYTQLGSDSNQVVLAIGIALAGFGVGATIPPTMAFMYRAVAPEAAARATGGLFILNQLGGAVGIAAAAVLLQRGGSTTSVIAFGDTYWLVVGFSVVAAIASVCLPGPFRVPVEEAVPATA
ncbi:DHA2 family efflux MFS transporter permease subunit [Amycolatopsis japonica]